MQVLRVRNQQRELNDIKFDFTRGQLAIDWLSYGKVTVVTDTV